tara:strand:- start:361 stop:1002 length:642 start_codon:yes stop_codon:yes gene_type:complete
MSEENVIPEPELKTYTQAEVDALTMGLKSKNDELLGEKKEANRIAKEHAQAEQATREELAYKDGDLETIRKSSEERYNTRESELLEQLSQRDKLLLGSKTQSSLTDLSADFSNPEIGKRLLANSVDTRLVDGQTVTFYKDGAFETDDISAFKSHLSAQPLFQSLLKGIDLQGGGAAEKKNGGAVNTKLNRTQLAQLANTDPAKYDQYINKKVN